MKCDPDTLIGNFDWDACEGCKHYPPEEGGCNVPREKWRLKLEFESDYIYCGAREPIGKEMTA